MKFEKPFPAPERIPDVPARLAICIERYIVGTTRIGIEVRDGTRRERINTLDLEGEGVGEEELVGALVTACAEHDANVRGQCGKYRAVLHRRLGVERECKYATFPIDVETEEQRLHKRRIRWTGRTWPDIALAYMRLLETATELEHHLMGAVVEQQRQRTREAVCANRMRALVSELAALCEDGLRMQSEAAREAMTRRVQERLEEERAQLGAKAWDALAPFIEAAIVRIFEGLAAGAPRDAGENQPATDPGPVVLATGESDASEAPWEPDAERNEGAPPSSGDAPSPGKEAADS